MGTTNNTFRVERRPKRTIIDRRSINDRSLSFRARGVLVWLLDKPDGWRVQAREIAAQSDKEGRDAVGTALDELRTKGYIVTTKYRAENGQWATDNCVYERPVWEGDRDGKPGTVNQSGLAGPVSQGLTPESTETDNCDDPQTPSGAPPAAAQLPYAEPPVPTPESLRRALQQHATTTRGES